MKLTVAVVCCLLLAMTSTEAKRKRRNLAPKLRLDASPAVVIEGFSDDLTIDCRVSKTGGDELTPVYLLLQKVNENGTVESIGLQLSTGTKQLAKDNRTLLEGAIGTQDGDESFLTWSISEPGFFDEGEYVCHYLYLTTEVFTIRAAVNVTVKALPIGEEYVPPPPPVAQEGCCEEALEEIEKLKAGLSTQSAAAPVAADASCQAAFSAGLREERGYILRTGRTIVFDTILTNKGGAYDASTGKFTAPCTGRYFFSLTLTALHSTSGTVEGIIRRGTKNQARSVAFTSGYDDMLSASTSVLLTLQQGEEVDVLLDASSDGEYIGADKTIFSGFYLFP